MVHCRQVEHQQNFKKGKGARGRGIQGGAGGRSRKKHGRKQNTPSSGLDVSSEDHGISTLWNQVAPPPPTHSFPRLIQKQNGCEGED